MNLKLMLIPFVLIGMFGCEVTSIEDGNVTDNTNSLAAITNNSSSTNSSSSTSSVTDDSSSSVTSSESSVVVIIPTTSSTSSSSSIVGRFSRKNGVVLDSDYELEWQDNETVEKSWLSRANYNDKDYFNTLGDTADSYCSNLKLNGKSDWRVPTLNELGTLIDTDSYPTIHPIFENKTANFYLSATTQSRYNPERINLYNFADGTSTYGTKNDNYQVRCVRFYNEKYATNKFVRKNDVVQDTVNELEWQDNESINKAWVTDENYNDKNYFNTQGDTAEEYCANLELDGKSNWRVPTLKELGTLINTNYYPTIHPIFQNKIAYFYLSSTTQSRYNPERSTLYNFALGYDTYSNKNYAYRVRCVRFYNEKYATNKFVRKNDVVQDTVNELEWQDNESINKAWVTDVNYNDKNYFNTQGDTAEEYCANLELDGKSNWRVPTLKELGTLINTNYYPTIHPIFQNKIAYFYLSSTTQSRYNPERSTLYNFALGYDTYSNKNYAYQIRCVRTP